MKLPKVRAAELLGLFAEGQAALEYSRAQNHVLTVVVPRKAEKVKSSCEGCERSRDLTL